MREAARRIFLKGVEAVEPAAAVKRYCRREGDRLFIGESVLDLSAFKRILVVGAGKASAPMALAVEQILGDRITRGIVNVKYGYTAPVQRIDLVEAGHPVADENGVRGARQILDLITGAGHKRSDSMLDFRRRVSAAASACRIDFPGRQAGDASVC